MNCEVVCTANLQLVALAQNYQVNALCLVHHQHPGSIFHGLTNFKDCTTILRIRRSCQFDCVKSRRRSLRAFSRRGIQQSGAPEALKHMRSNIVVAPPSEVE